MSEMLLTEHGDVMLTRKGITEKEQVLIEENRVKKMEKMRI
jgi:hypothetical protein